MAFANAAARRVGEIGVMDGVFVVDLGEDAVVGNKIFDRSPVSIVGIELLRELIQLQRRRRRIRRAIL